MVNSDLYQGSVSGSLLAPAGAGVSGGSSAGSGAGASAGSVASCPDGFAVGSSAFVWGVGGRVLRGVVCSCAALRWRAGVVARLRFDCVLSSGRVSSVFVPVASLRAAAFRCSAFCAGRGVLRCSAFLSDGRWVCSGVA